MHMFLPVIHIFYGRVKYAEMNGDKGGGEFFNHENVVIFYF